MNKVYLVDICQSNGEFKTYRCAFRSKKAAEKFASLFAQETKIFVVDLVSMNDI